MLGVRWQERKTNESIRQKVHRKETVMDTIRHLLLFGHICRMPDDRLASKESVAGLSWRCTAERKTSKEVDRQHHRVD